MAAPFLANHYSPKKHLSFTSMRKVLSTHFRTLPDKRQASKINYSVHDAFMSGFACMYFQSSSILAFQRQLDEQRHTNNLQTLFDVKSIPKDYQLRDIIDTVDSDCLRPCFKQIFAQLQRGKHLKHFEFMPGYYLCSIDGTQVHRSKSVYCEHCLTKQHRHGSVTYSHCVLQAAMMHPDCRQVLPLMPEEVKNTDGSDKQDCEINAAKRLLPKLREDHPQLGMIIVGDGLFSKAPFIANLKAQDMRYILVAKPDDHTYMMEWLAVYPELHTYETLDEKGRRHHYEWMGDVPLNGQEDPPRVNYFHYQLFVPQPDGTEKLTYQNSWVTDLELSQKTVIQLVKAGRCRWKIESVPQAHKQEVCYAIN